MLNCCGFQNLFVCDSAGWLFAGVFLLTGLLAVIYSLSAAKAYKHKAEYYFFISLVILSATALSFCRNLILIYILWEIIAFSAWRLYGFFREEKGMLFADKAFLLTFFGSCFMLLGFVLLYKDYRTFSLVEMEQLAAGGLKPSLLAMVFIFSGIIAKSATLPLQSWLPDAYSTAPLAVCAFSSALMAKVGVLGFVRIFVQTFSYTGNWVLVIAALSSIAAASTALLETNPRRILANSTISQLGFIFLGLGLGGKLGLVSALVYFMAHSVAKAGLFMSLGVVEQATGKNNIREMGGLIRTMPITGISFAACALSIMGIPPFFGFYPKLGTVMALVGQGRIFFAVAALIIAIMTMIYMGKMFSGIFLGENADGVLPAKEGTALMLVVIIILATLSLQMGIFPGIPLGWADAAANFIK